MHVRGKQLMKKETCTHALSCQVKSGMSSFSFCVRIEIEGREEGRGGKGKKGEGSEVLSRLPASKDPMKKDDEEWWVAERWQKVAMAAFCIHSTCPNAA